MGLSLLYNHLPYDSRVLNNRIYQMTGGQVVLAPSLPVGNHLQKFVSVLQETSLCQTLLFTIYTLFQSTTILALGSCLRTCWQPYSSRIVKIAMWPSLVCIMKFIWQRCDGFHAKDSSHIYNATKAKAASQLGTTNTMSWAGMKSARVPPIRNHWKWS